MTVQALVPVDIEEARPISHDGGLVAAEFEAIIRAWKGEAIDLMGVVPISPVGEVDWDGSLALGQIHTDEIYAMCQSYTYFDTHDCGPSSTYDCTGPEQFTCPTSPYGGSCISNDWRCP